MLIIIVCESSSEAQTDYKYINTTIKKFYSLERNNIKLKPLYLHGKGNFKNVQNKIKKLSSEYLGEIEVVYCIDLDSYLSSPSDNKINDTIREYCQLNGYKFVWFNENIEQVFIGRDVESSSKTKAANNYLKNSMIDNLDPKSIYHKEPLTKKTSNLLLILDELIGKFRIKNQ